MASVHITNLTATNFRSFPKLDVAFPPNGKVLIRGLNKDTGYSSGSGKTSVILALAYAFGASPYPATELKGWNSKEPMQVTVKMDTDQGPVVLHRGSRTSITIDGTVIQGSVAAVDDALQKLIGMDFGMLRALTYRPQRTFGLFLNRTDSEKKEFLSTLLGLDAFEQAVEKAEERRKAASYRRDPAANRELNTKTRMNDLEGGEKHTPELDVEVQKDLRVAQHSLKLAMAKATEIGNELLQLDLEIQEQEAAIIAVRKADSEKLEKTLESVRKRIARGELEHNASKQAALSKYEKALAKAYDLQGAPYDLSHIKAKLEEAKDKLLSMRAAKCPTCGQEWLVHQEKINLLADEVLKLEADYDNQKVRVDEYRSLKKDADGLFSATKNIPEDPMLSKLREAQKNIEKQLKDMGAAMYSRIEEELAPYKAKRKELRQALDRFEGDCRAYETRIHKAEETIKGIRSRNQFWAEQAEKRRNDYEAACIEHNEALVNLNAIDREISAEQDFIALVGREGFLGSIFDEVLDEISAEANAILAAIPNVAHVTIQFKSEAETKKGSTKKKITPALYLSGEARSLAGLSGGMTQAVELAVDFAVAEVISRRTGTNPGWLVLDEAFTGLSVGEMEAAMAILDKMAQSRLVLVIDHNTEIKEMFTETINVVYSNGISAIVEDF